MERADAGTTARSSVIKLLDLQPGAEALDLAVEAGELASVTLVSPMGYSVLEATPTP